MRMLTTLLASLTLLTTTAFAGPPNFDMVFVKGGCYQMGDTFGDGTNNEQPVHRVCVNDFHMGKYVVTQAQYQAVMDSNPSIVKELCDNCPVDNVSYDDAQRFIKKLNEQTGKKYRLPYEVEWEYAARSGGRQERWAGTSDLEELEDYAWFEDNSDRMGNMVGTKKPNGLGLYDMSGNVWEWSNDWYDNKYYTVSPVQNPRGPLSGSYRVIRGGCRFDSATFIRATNRDGNVPSYRGNCYGFRLVLPAVH